MSYEDGSLTCNDCNSCIEKVGVLVGETYGFKPRLKMVCEKCAEYHCLKGDWYKVIKWKMSKNNKVESLKGMENVIIFIKNLNFPLKL